MKKNQTRRKFITTAVSGVAASAAAPMAFAEKQPELPVEKSVNTTKAVFARKMVNSIRIAPYEFIIFPWGWMPDSPANGEWGDIADINAMMKDLFDCGCRSQRDLSSRQCEAARKV